jgi:hypothetical protein
MTQGSLSFPKTTRDLRRSEEVIVPVPALMDMENGAGYRMVRANRTPLENEDRLKD